MSDGPQLRQNSRGPAAAMLGLAILTIGGVGGVTAVSEGKSNAAYVDVLATSRVVTICYGNTHGVKLGDTKTDAECRSMLAQGLAEHARLIVPAIKRDISAKTLGSFVDFTYNVGPGTFLKSSILREYNAGHEEASCNAIMKYKYSGGKDCTVAANRCMGITARRQAEVRLCKEGLK